MERVVIGLHDIDARAIAQHRTRQRGFHRVNPDNPGIKRCCKGAEHENKQHAQSR